MFSPFDPFDALFEVGLPAPRLLPSTRLATTSFLPTVGGVDEPTVSMSELRNKLILEMQKSGKKVSGNEEISHSVDRRRVSVNGNDRTVLTEKFGLGENEITKTCQCIPNSQMLDLQTTTLRLEGKPERSWQNLDRKNVERFEAAWNDAGAQPLLDAGAQPLLETSTPRDQEVRKLTNEMQEMKNQLKELADKHLVSKAAHKKSSGAA